MENVVSARRLRKSVLKDISDFTIDKDIFLDKPLKKIDNYNSFEKDIEFGEHSKNIFSNFKLKLLIKVFMCVIILFSCLLSKLVFYNNVRNINLVDKVVVEYKKDYAKENVMLKLEGQISKFYSNYKYLIPSKIANFTKNKYYNFKPKFLNFDFKNLLYSSKVVEEVAKMDENQNENNPTLPEEQKPLEDETLSVISNNVGIGGGSELETKTEEVEEVKYEESISAVSIMDDDVSAILAKSIKIGVPTTGKITSKYGVRNVIFNDADPYHTGLDIANVLGTNIFSATEGTVVNVEQNNKYYGKLIEIESSGVIFKYGHLNETLVSKDQKVNLGDLIGHMGSTGYSTGSHLHFEIRINGRSVNPQELVDIK